MIVIQLGSSSLDWISWLLLIEFAQYMKSNEKWADGCIVWGNLTGYVAV